MKKLYSLGIRCYAALVKAASGRNRKARLLAEGQRTLFRELERKVDPEARYCWFHASSLGEFEQGRPLMEALRRHDPSVKILLTFFSPSGYEVRKNWSGADLICYLPYDTPDRVTRFLDMVRPRMAVFIKYEFWANYLTELKRRQVPTYLVSGIFRPSQLFFRPYGGFYRSLLTCFTQLYLQDETSQALLASIDITHTVVCGDTRFDRVCDIRAAARPLPLAERFSENVVHLLVVGSSWPVDETFLLPYFNGRPDLKLIIAPHEIDEDHLREIEARLQRPFVRYTQADEATVAQADCLIVDCFGLLSSIYRYGDLAYVGGGFGAGIHNITEAAVYGVPVLFGPRNEKFKEARQLVACKGGFIVEDETDFRSLADRLLDDEPSLRAHGERAGRYIAGHAGATAVILPDLLAALAAHR